MPYRYQEPKPVEFESLPPGEYDFTVVAIQDTYMTPDGNFVLPVQIQIKGTQKTVYDYPGAGKSKKDQKPYDTIAPFLKAIRRNPAVDEEPDFSVKNLVGARGTCKLKIEEYQGEKRNKVSYYVYDREQVTATISGGSNALPKQYADGPSAISSITTTKDDNIPF